MQGKLYLVATPIGNLEDITWRALSVLARVDGIYAEDTRRSYQLLKRFDIRRRLLSYHDHNVSRRLPEILGRLKRGEEIALVSDAGTPLVSDPGFRLVREVLRRGIKVVPVPGASAVITALISSGLPPYPFLFLGYLPRGRKKRRQVLSDWHRETKVQPLTVVAFESVHRLRETLRDIACVLGEDTRVCVAREMTKLHEEFLRGTVKEVLEQLEKREKLRGEITLVWRQETMVREAGLEPAKDVCP